jgi:hypothetical protein
MTKIIYIIAGILIVLFIAEAYLIIPDKMPFTRKWWKK